MINQEHVSAHARHFFYLQRVGTSEFNRFSKILAELERGILSRLPADLSDFSRTRLNQQLKTLRDFQSALYDAHIGKLNKSLEDLSAREAAFEMRLLRSTLLKSSGAEFVSPSFHQIMTALRTSPLAVGANGAGKLLAPFIDDWKKSQIEAVNGIVRQGWFEGQTVNQMASGVRDSISGQTARTAEAIVRTSINHVSQIARSSMWAANDDIIEGWKFLAVFDERTSNECRSISGLDEVYPLNKGPFPPRHPNCRSTTIPVLKDQYTTKDKSSTRSAKGEDGKEQVKANVNDYDWLKSQPEEFIVDSIGKTRADLLLSGKLNSKEFAKFTLSSKLKPLTVAEMAQKDKRLNLGLFD